MKITRNSALALGVAALVVLLDQASKLYLMGPFHLAERGSVTVAPFFHLTAVSNPGVSLGFFQAHGDVGRWSLVLFAAVVVAFLAQWLWRTDRLISALALGFIIGGAVGNNLIDRVRLGWVIDFFDFSGLGFPWVFNVADVSIDVGIALLLLDLALTPSPSKPVKT